MNTKPRVCNFNRTRVRIVQHKPHLSDAEVKKHLVNRFHVFQSPFYLLCLKLILKTFWINPLQLLLFLLKHSVVVFKLLSQSWKTCRNVIWLKGWVAKVMNAPIDPAGDQRRESTNSQITLVSHKPACILHNRAIIALLAPSTEHYYRQYYIHLLHPY